MFLCEGYNARNDLFYPIIANMSKQERSFRLQAVVLRHWDYGETDRMVILFTKERGKLTALAKGARKPLSRKAGHLEPFTQLSLQLAQGSGIPMIIQAETIEAYLPLRQDLSRLSQALYVLEVLERFTFEGEENRPLYQLAVQTLQRLAALYQPQVVLRYFDVQMLSMVGYRPQLCFCVSCKSEIKPADQYFSAALGGVLCPRCGKHEAGVWAISLNGLKYLRHFQRSSFTEASRVNLSESIGFELENILHGYYAYLLERTLNTPSFLHRVNAKEE